ncbi:uncharacterized protein Dana_GF27891 [Drosophila ananassae]|uniref:Uncharacterized protein n=1 Tax=Drosophila ananassae TaxID=7217 RepID=A0A0P9C1H5_DROAN|nr:uncharacterized protein Dana_GF27891 [Drosophila ananassae]
MIMRKVYMVARSENRIESSIGFNSRSDKESESESESEPRPWLVLLLIALRIRLVRSQQVDRRRAGAERDNRQKRASLGVLVC